MNLRDYQSETIKRLISNYNKNKKRNLIVLATGLGKCLKIDTPVLMYDGSIKKVQDIVVGDQLMGPDSTPRNVLSLARGSERMYDVVPTKGETWGCNESHILSLVCNNKKRKEYGQIVDISVKDYLKKSATFKHTHKLFKVGVDFEEKELPVHPYLLGLWLGDGTTNGRAVCITNTDTEIQQWVKDHCNSIGLTLNIRENKNRAPTLSLVDPKATWKHRNKLTKAFEDLNLWNNKHIPKHYLTSSVEQRLQLLAGLIDTDGYLVEGVYEITTKFDKLKEDIIYLARSLGLFVSFRKKRSTIKSIGFEGEYWRLFISGDLNKVPCRVERKKAKLRKQIKDPLRTGFTLVDKGIGNYYGFVIDGDHRFLLGDFTVTHNTTIATELHKLFKPEKKTLFLVDRIELAYQARDEFMENNPGVKVGIEMNEHRARKHDQVVIACVPTIGRKGSYRIGKFSPDDFGKIIVDEAHTSITDTFIRVLSYLGVGPKSKIKDKLLVGMTATPNRTDGLSLGYLYDDITVNYDISYGIRSGYLTDIELITVKTGTDISKIHFTDHRLDELADVIDNPIRNTLIVKTYKEQSDGECAIVYCANVQHAHDVAEMFRSAGISAHAIDATTDKNERKQLIAKYKKGEIKILCNYGVLTTGFNAPETTTIILARPIKSDLLLRQIIGRGLRPSQTSFINFIKKPEKRVKAIENSTKPSCKVISMFDNIGEHRIVSVPSLFGLNPELKLGKKHKKLYKDVVEPIEEVKREKKVDPKNILNFDDINSIVKNKKLQIKSLEIPQEVKQHTDKSWIEIADDEYEISYSKDKKSLIVSKNALDRYELLEYDHKLKLTKKLNDFYDLSGAIGAGDKYSNRHYDTTFDKRAGYDKGVTKAQKELICRILRGGVKVLKEHYPDTGEPVLVYRKTGERLNRVTASNLLDRITKRK